MNLQYTKENAHLWHQIKDKPVPYGIDVLVSNGVTTWIRRWPLRNTTEAHLWITPEELIARMRPTELLSEARKMLEQNKKEEEKTMSNTTEILKSDAHYAVVRTAANKVVKATKKIVIRLLKAQGIPTEILNTPAGEALIAFLIGSLPLAVPRLNDNTIIDDLATELRTRGLQFGTDLVGDKLLDPIINLLEKTAESI